MKSQRQDLTKWLCFSRVLKRHTKGEKLNINRFCRIIGEGGGGGGGGGEGAGEEGGGGGEKRKKEKN